jgi:hypothetical protein
VAGPTLAGSAVSVAGFHRRRGSFISGASSSWLAGTAIRLVTSAPPAAGRVRHGEAAGAALQRGPVSAAYSNDLLSR